MPDSLVIAWMPMPEPYKKEVVMNKEVKDWLNTKRRTYFHL